MRGRFSAQSVGDYFQHAVHIVHDVVIPEPQNLIVVLVKPSIAHPVLNAVVVLTTVNFDDQSLFAT